VSKPASTVNAKQMVSMPSNPMRYYKINTRSDPKIADVPKEENIIA
jgi:hypothetical protein